MFAYSNNGLDFRAVGPDYQAAEGEVLFPDQAKPSDLDAAFPGYGSAVAAVARIPLIVQAQAALDASDRTVWRCYEADIPVPESWRAYRQALRAVIRGESDALPDRPDYPEGT